MTPVSRFVTALLERVGPLHLYSADATQSMRLGARPHGLVVTEVGVAEHLALSLAAGRATALGERVLVTGFSAFLSLRGAECLRVIARERLPVTVLGLLPGLTASRDGAAHQCLHEVGMLGSFGLDSFLWPADTSAAEAAADIVADATGPSWVSLCREEAPKLPAWSAVDRGMRWRVLRSGTGAAIVAYGRMVRLALNASSGCSVVEVLDPLALGPERLRVMLAAAGPRVIVLEEQAEPAPLAARCMAFAPSGVTVTGLGADPAAMQSGAQDEVLAAAGLSRHRIEQALRKLGD